MSNGILDSWARHATASEEMKLMGERDYHQKAGYNFMQNFPKTPVPIANVLAKGYQYGTEGLKSLINPFDNYTFSDAMKRAAEESRLNMLGIKGEGFDINEYTDFINKFDAAYDDKPVINVKNQEPKTLGFSYSGYPARAEITTDMILPQSKPIDELNQFDNITNTGVNKRPKLTDRIKSGIETMRDKLGSVKDFITEGGIIGQALQGLGNMFEYRGGIGYVDENGNFISAEELDKQNARGGYYTDVARASRRRDSAIQRMLQRRKEGKRISEANLEKYIKQQKLEKAAREEAARVAAERATLDQYFGGSGAGPDGNRYDGADSFETYSAEPTAYSGSS